MSLTMESVLDRLQTIQGKPPAKQSAEVRLTVIECKHCGARYWHHLGHLATDGKIAGGPCCFGHPVLTGCQVSDRGTGAAGLSMAGRNRRTGTRRMLQVWNRHHGIHHLSRRAHAMGMQSLLFQGRYRPLPIPEKAITAEMVRPSHG